MNKLLLKQLTRLIDSIDRLAPPTIPATNWQAFAFRWRKWQHAGYLQSIENIQHINLADIHHVDKQKQQLYDNTQQFMANKPANNVLLTGARGTGKSSLIKAVFNVFKNQGLRLIEIDRADLIDLPDIIQLIQNRAERFIIFCDDLSFNEGEHQYKALKTALDGSIAALSSNILIYATSNRRHLVPEYHHENTLEIHANEAVEEKIALSERFGLWLTFYPFDQSQYLQIVQYWLQQLGYFTWDEEVSHAALQWALTRGARNGRVAGQFARDWVGKQT